MEIRTRTLAGALAAAKLNIPVAHVEAGLRSFNRRMPEEVNRIVSDHVSTLLFCPTETAVRNLATEGITEGVHAVGDVMFDSTLAAAVRAADQSTILESLGLKTRGYAVATIHRAENTDDPQRFSRVVAMAGTSRSRQAGCEMPVHPRTRKLLSGPALTLSGLTLINPVGYLDMVRLLSEAEMVFTTPAACRRKPISTGSLA